MIEQEKRTARYGTPRDYIATFTEEERQELAVAKLALMAADALERTRRKRNARAVVTLPVSSAEVNPERLRAYLCELGHGTDVRPQQTPRGEVLEVVLHEDGTR